MPGLCVSGKMVFPLNKCELVGQLKMLAIRLIILRIENFVDL